MSVVQEFRDREIARLERSGWATNATLRQRLEGCGRPPRSSPSAWTRAQETEAVPALVSVPAGRGPSAQWPA